MEGEGTVVETGLAEVLGLTDTLALGVGVAVAEGVGLELIVGREEYCGVTAFVVRGVCNGVIKLEGD